MPRAPAALEQILQELTPTAPPADASAPVLELFEALQALLQVELEAPEEVEAVMARWQQLEERAACAETGARSAAHPAARDEGTEDDCAAGWA